MTNIDIVPATPQILECFEMPTKTVRALAAVKNKRVIGVFGTYTQGAVKVVFSKLTDEMRKDKRAIIMGVRAVQKLYADSNVPVLAKAEDIDGSETLLEHMGFEHTGNRVFVWRG